MPTPSRPSLPGRIAAVDVLRGGALGGMLIYHLLWDLHAFGLSAVDPAGTPAVRWFGHAVAASFLVLSGLSLDLAEAARHSWRRVLGRLGVLALAAGGVTLATALVVPDAVVSFGILHCLAVTNGLALLLRRLPNVMLALLAAVAFVLPSVWPWPLGPAWAWLGLSADAPVTLDFRPVLPWLALTLLGLVAGRTALVPWLARFRPHRAATRATAAAGRHSLLIYLLHQPILIGLIGVVVLASGVAGQPTAEPLAPEQAAAFLASCARSCTNKNGDPALCRATCHCVLTGFNAPAAPTSLLDRLRPAQARLQHAVAACSRSLG